MNDECPSGCGRALPRGKVMCAPCWREVPPDLQREVYAAWRARQAALRPNSTADYMAAAQRHEDAKAAAVGSIR